MQRTPTIDRCCRLLLWRTNAGLSDRESGSSLILHSPSQRDNCKNPFGNLGMVQKRPEHLYNFGASMTDSFANLLL